MAFGVCASLAVSSLEGASQARDKYIKGEMTKEEALKIVEVKD